MPAHFPSGRKRNKGRQLARPATNSCIVRQLARLKDEELFRQTAAFAFSDSSHSFFFKEPEPAEPSAGHRRRSQLHFSVSPTCDFLMIHQGLTTNTLAVSCVCVTVWHGDDSVGVLPDGNILETEEKNVFFFYFLFFYRVLVFYPSSSSFCH